ncbi:MAG: hypothetical protein IIX67_03295 [Clostridia bacterium]|nr:hypothetical protein [Clostridia bacterium]
MTDKAYVRVHRIIGALVAVFIIIAGLCLAFGCCYIYFSDGLTYSRAAVGDVFASVCIPVYACLVFVVIGFLVELLLPNTKKATAKASVSSENRLNNLLKKRELESLNDEAIAVHYREKGKRTVNSIIMTALTVVASVVFFIYALDADNFDSTDINGSVISALYILIPCIVIPFLFYLYLLIDRERGFRRELEMLKRVQRGDIDPDRKPKLENIDVYSRRIGKFFENAVAGKPLVALRISLIAIALLCLIFGLCLGGTADVFTKASNICTECIGLG